MAFHHLTTPYWTVFRVIRVLLHLDPELSVDIRVEEATVHEWRLFAICIAAHHVIMCAYFSERRETKWLRLVMPWTQAVQLGVGSGVDGWRLWEQGVAGWREEGGRDKELMQGRAVAAGLLCVYAWLYLGEVRDARRRRGLERVQEGNEERKRSDE